MFKRILVATDGSSLADKAVSTALSLADTCGAEVVALLVVPDYTTQEFAEVLFRDGPSFEELRNSLREAGRRLLDRALAPHSAAGRLIERHVALSDAPHEQILLHAARQHCDLIVMASRGRGALKSALLGSQTVHVMTGSTVPVMVVK
jgi:nucleotide-binding universal stress UspA family protein